MGESARHIAVVYEYAADSGELHERHGAAHVEFLQTLFDAGVLLLSGRIDNDGHPGALMILSAAVGNSSHAPGSELTLLDEDPFWKHGVVAKRRLWPWSIFFGADALSPPIPSEPQD